MKKLYIFALAFAASTYSLMAADITLTVGTFEDNVIDVKVGDVITFVTGNSHPVRQVSEADYINNAKTLLPGGIDITTSSTNKTYTVKESDKGTMYLICVNHVGGGMKAKLSVSGTTSLNTTTTASFNVFPNPTLGVLNLSTSGTYDVEVTTMNGSAVTEMFTVGNSIDLSALPKGEYLVRFKNENNLVVRKVIKK